MRLSEALTAREVDSKPKGMRLSEAMSVEKPVLEKQFDVEIRNMTPEMQREAVPLDAKTEMNLQMQRNIRYVEEYPVDYYSGSSAVLDAYGVGVSPIEPRGERPGLREAHPIAVAVGELSGLMAASAVTAPVGVAVTLAPKLAALPTLAQIAAGRMAHSGLAFGIKDLADNMAEIAGGDKKTFGKVVGSVASSTGLGAGLGLIGGIAAPLKRVPAQAAYGFATAKIAGATNFEAGVNAAIFGVFGLFNTKNFNNEYKISAFNGAKRALIDRMIAKGIDPNRAEAIATRYFGWALNKNGGFKNAKIKDFDEFSKAMRKGWKIIVEPEMKPTGAPSGGAAKGAPKDVKTYAIAAPKGEVPKFEKMMYRGSGTPKSEIYNQAQYPVAGEGTYYAYNKPDASLYGENITSHRVALSNPLTIKNDDEWKALAKEAGWKYPNLYGASEQDQIASSKQLRETVLAKGYDGLIINLTGDQDQSKVLRNVFGHDTVIDYSPKKAAVFYRGDPPSEMPKGEVDPLKFQDANQEGLAKTGFASGDTSAQFEAGGDIFRELTKETPDSSYIKEKITSINRYWEGFDVRGDSENLSQLRKHWENQPVNTTEQQLAKELNLAIIDRDKSKVDSILSKLTQPTDPLTTEARKYPTAEEFVKGQGIVTWEEAKTQRDITGDLPSDKYYYHVSPVEQSGVLKSKSHGVENKPVVWLQKGQPQYTTEGYLYAIDPSKVTVRVAKGNTNAFVHEGDITSDAIISLGKLSEEGLTQKQLHNRFTSQLTSDYNAKYGKPTQSPLTTEARSTKPTAAIPAAAPAEPTITAEMTELPAETIFPDVDTAFLEQPKKHTGIQGYLVPAEFHLKQLGFDAKIGVPIREALWDFNMELAKKVDFLNKAKKQLETEVIDDAQRQKIMDDIFRYMDKGVPAEAKDTVAGRIAAKFRPETEEMLARLNKVREGAGLQPIAGVENYILHQVKAEILKEIFDSGKIPPELAKLIANVPADKALFLRTAMERKGVPEEWLVKDPFELMRAMYAIDLRYIHLQNALNQVEPYLNAVKHYEGPTTGDAWSKADIDYLETWIRQAIKGQPSSMDQLINDTVSSMLSPILKRANLSVASLPYSKFMNLMSGAAQVGGLGLRVKAVLRNLTQTSHDWVLWGTSAYAKGVTLFHSPEGFRILNDSKVWHARLPFEARERGSFNKVMMAGSVGYRMADMYNVGKGLLTIYSHARDRLGMAHEQAIKFADHQIPGSQWSYSRHDLPRIYWSSTGRALSTFGSWWMNFYGRFLPDMLGKAFSGKAADGRPVPVVERLAVMRFLMYLGTLYGVKQVTKELTGTAVDYVGQASPMPFGQSPQAKTAEAIVQITQGLVGRDDRKLKEGMRNLSYTVGVFVPYMLGVRELWEVLTGQMALPDYLFYTDTKKQKTTTTAR